METAKFFELGSRGCLPGSFESLIYIHAVGRQTVWAPERTCTRVYTIWTQADTGLLCFWVFRFFHGSVQSNSCNLAGPARLLLLTRSVPPSWNWAADRRPTRRLRTLKLINKRASSSSLQKKNLTKTLKRHETKKMLEKKMRIALKNIRKRGELTVSKFRTRTSLCSCLSLDSLLQDVKQKKTTTKQQNNSSGGCLDG